MRQGGSGRLLHGRLHHLCLSGERKNAANTRQSARRIGSIVDGIVSKGMTEELKSYGIIEKEEDWKEFLWLKKSAHQLLSK